MRLPPLPAVIATLAGAMLVLPHLLARPHVLALPALVAWCGALLAARDDARGPPWVLLPVMALWANLHGSFMFGLALAGFLAAEAMLRPAPGQSRSGEARRWGAFVTAACVAALLTPNGLAGLIQPLRLLFMPALQSGFVEWAPADLAKFPALEAWLLGAIALGFALRTRLPWTRLLLLLGLFHMALAHVRHADLVARPGQVQRRRPPQIPVTTEDQNSHLTPSVSVTARFHISVRNQFRPLTWDNPENPVKEGFGFPNSAGLVTKSLRFGEDFLLPRPPPAAAQLRNLHAPRFPIAVTHAPTPF